MNKANPYKLSIERMEDILDTGPIIPRCYEVTYLKSSKKMKININKDENKSKNIYKGEGLCGRWCCENEKYMLFFQINVISNENSYEKVKEKDKKIREELPLMINSIIKSEEKFLKKNKDLMEAEIFIKFNSTYDDFYKVESFGELKNYINIEAYAEKELKEKDVNSKLKTIKNNIDINKNIILNLINPHIEIYLSPMYGKEVKFLINEIELLSIKELDSIDGYSKEHEIVASIKIINKNYLEEAILDIKVKSNGVSIKNIA
ncbi:MAG: staygreen family protein [Clostridium sp.]|uniref:staygreen family protein n=1 Tax=Clostridium sp. TaxID=1506 RepID=UPI002A9100A6|nr:staygreen family protein [Clostridium sp.]MDY6226993.1 staygreen family protein [Clostridium sp.]